MDSKIQSCVPSNLWIPIQRDNYRHAKIFKYIFEEQFGNLECCERWFCSYEVSLFRDWMITMISMLTTSHGWVGIDMGCSKPYGHPHWALTRWHVKHDWMQPFTSNSIWGKKKLSNLHKCLVDTAMPCHIVRNVSLLMGEVGSRIGGVNKLNSGWLIGSTNESTR